MDLSKKDTLIQWLNKLNPQLVIESLYDLREGEQFVALLNKIKGHSYDANTKKERFEIIQKFIEDNYHHSLIEQVNFDRDNELDLAKIAVLVLAVGVEGENREVFMNAALSLNERSQLEIMGILKEILNVVSSDLHLDDILINKSLEAYDSENSSENSSQEDKSSEKSPSASFVEELLIDKPPNTGSLNDILSPFQRINVNYSTPSTPLHALITSSGFNGRIIQRERNLRKKTEEEIEKKNILLRKLGSDLNSERHLRSEIEYDLEENKKTISLKDDKIRELNNQIRDLKKLQDQIDEYDNIKNQYDQLVADADKVKSQHDELKSLKLENTSLKNENAEVYEELKKLKEVKSQLKVAQLDQVKNLKELHLEQRKSSNLQLHLDHKQKVLDETIQSKNFTEDNLAKLREMYEVLKKDYEETLAFQSEKQPTGENMSVVTDHLMTELKTELEDIKTTWIAPDIHEQLKIDLSKLTSERDILESKLLKLHEESLNLNSNNDILKNQIEKLKIEQDNDQRHILDKQHMIEKLKEDLECFSTKESNWQQTETKYKSELQQQQAKVAQIQQELSTVSTELKLTNMQVESDTKHNENRRQTLIMSMDSLKCEKKSLEQKFLSEKASLEEEIKNLCTQLESAKEEFSAKQQELVSDYENSLLEKQELERQLGVEQRLRESAEKILVSQREEAAKELADNVDILKTDIKKYEQEVNSLQSTIREKTKDFDSQIESHKTIKFELERKITKLESHMSTSNQENITLQTELKAVEETVLGLKQTTVKLNDKLSKSDHEKTLLHGKIQDVQNKLAEAISESQHWMKKNSTEKEDFEAKLNTLVQENSEILETSKVVQEKLSEQLRSSSEENSLLNNKLQELMDQIEDMKTEIKERFDENESLQDQLSQLQNLYKDLQEQNDIVNNNCTKTQSQLTLKETECIEFEKKLTNIQAEKLKMEEKHSNELGSTRQALSQEIINLNQQIEKKHFLLEESKSSLQNFSEKIFHAIKPNVLTEDLELPTDLNDVISFLHQKVYQCVEETSNERECLQNQLSSQSVNLEEMKQNFESQLKVHEESYATLKNQFENIVCEHRKLQDKLVKQEKALEEHTIVKQSLEEAKTVLENQLLDKEKYFETELDCIRTKHETIKSHLEENTSIKKDLVEQIEELTREKQDILEKLEQETANSKEVATSLKSELETVKQSAIEQERKFKVDFEELTKHYTLLMDEKHMESLKEVEQVNVQLCDKDKRICELSNVLTEKSSLVEEYLNSNNELTQVVTSLKENVSEKETETNLLKKELEEKSGTISEKDAKLDELTSLVGEMQKKVSEISQEHVSEIGKLQENLKVEYEERISSFTSEYENKITSDYVCKSLVEIKEKEHSKELETAKETLHQEYNQKSCCLVEEYEKKLKSVSEDFEKKLSSDYVAVGEINEQNKKHIQEVIQMKEKLEEYEGKIKSQDEEHKEALQKVMVEFQENISKNYISKEVFEAKLKDETIKYTQLEQKYVEEEEKLQIVLKEHDEKLAQVTLNYEEKIATDFVPRQTFECEQEKHVTTLLEQQTLYQEKLESLNEIHKISNDKKVVEFEDNIATNYVQRSDFEDVQARLSQKEKEFSKQRAEYDLVVAACDKVNEQYESSVKTYEKKVTEMCKKIESRNKQIECLQEQIAEMTVKAEREYNEMKREQSQNLSDKDEEMRTSRQEMVNIQSAYEDEITKCKSLEEQINRLKDSHSQELALSQTKWEKLNETQCANISNYEKIVTEKEHQVADIQQQLLTEKEANAELEKYLASSKENHGEEIKKLNTIINEAKEEYHQLKKKISKTEVFFHSREQKLITDHTKTLSKAEEMNASLATRLHISHKESEIFKKKHENISAEVENIKEELKTTKLEKQAVVAKLQDYEVFYLQKEEEFSDVKHKLEMEVTKLNEKYSESRFATEKLEKLVEHYKTHEHNLLTKVNERDAEEKKNNERLMKKVMELEKEKYSISEILKKEQNNFQETYKECKDLKRKIVTLNEQLEKAEIALFNNSQSLNWANDSLESPASSTMKKAPYELRSRTSNTWNKMKVKDYNISPISVYSTSSIKSVASNASTSSRTPVPSGCGKMFACEDEPNTYDWSRLTEIKRRNTMVPAHLRSTYPAELQNIPSPFKADITLPRSASKRKRKSPVVSQKRHVKSGVQNNLQQVRIKKINEENTPRSDKRLRIKSPVGQKEYTGRPSMAFDISNTPKLARRRQKGRSTILQEPQPERKPLRTRNFTQTSL
ncbi:nuclear mitotic apparatus protein 1 isoform X1 [Octopus bimaculoides]|uniref:HOOK N-terminal domain-containing protein n=1 Tax=Octopus bimaculoides TaxID=37653 RepID=A0A0L8HUL6_OCTBM|nr:nuclear mitotic apparatus protein 1 isoform X1 [Octopus bimaculoides]|eukprot:XP_014769238.1 PREDICTED: centromere-associated protein E-like isoform X1 [Octopus bimaculoides]